MHSKQANDEEGTSWLPEAEHITKSGLLQMNLLSLPES